DVRQLDTWLNTGHGFPDAGENAPFYTPPEPIWSYAPSPAETRATFADLNGDGLADLAKAVRTGETTTIESHISRGTLGDRVVAIQDGLGALTRIEYAPLSDGDVYELGARPPYPQIAIAHPTPALPPPAPRPTPPPLHFF